MEGNEESPTVIIVGAGPAGLATAACLSVLSIPFVVLERDHCIASLWRHRTYNRLKLHLAKTFCQLPHMPHPRSAPTYIPKDDFILYMDEYAQRFGVKPRFGAEVRRAGYREGEGRWVVEVGRDGEEAEEIVGGFLVVATGENGKAVMPEVEGMEGFQGEVMHSVDYRCGEDYKGKSVLVVGSGNSGMEIAYDLSNYGALASISVRSKFHVMSKEMIHFGMILLKYKVPLPLVDKIIVILNKFKYGNLSKYGIVRPKQGPFFLKITKGRSPVIDAGTVEKIISGDIQVLPGISHVEGNWVKFNNGVSHYFDAIVFATGYKSIANQWLKDENHLLNENGLPSRKFPNHWKGENGVYCAGLARLGLDGISNDAKLIANDIHMIIKARRDVVIEEKKKI